MKQKQTKKVDEKKITEKTLEKNEVSNQSLDKKVNALIRENKDFVKQISSLNDELKVKNLTMKQFDLRANQIKDSDSILKRNSSANNIFRFDLEDKENIIQKQRKELQQLAEEISILKVSLELQRDNNKNIQNEIIQLKKLISVKDEELTKQKNENDQLHLEKKQEGCFQVELNHLRDEIKEAKSGGVPRKEGLVELSHVKEIVEKYSNKITGDRDFCHNCGKYIYSVRSCCMKKPNFEESVFLVPATAYEFIQQFRIRTKAEVSDVEMELLLFELNKIWCEKERQTLNLLKKQFESKMNDYKRHIDGKKSLEDKNEEFTLERVQKNLRDLQRENIELYGLRYARSPNIGK